MNLIDRTREGFRRTFGHDPAGVVFAPGRVNLIGEHVDYNDGLVLPMPIAAGTAIAWSPQDGGIDAVALDFGGERDRHVQGSAMPHHPADWRSYLRGMAACLADRGIHTDGAKLAIAGSIPRGSGLSSSASLCVAIGRALAAASGIAEPAPQTLALAAQSAEHVWAGVKCGIMDQMAVAAGEAGSALLLDCADLQTRQIPLPHEWAVLIVQSGVTRELVDGHYNQRRQDCEAAAAALGVKSLRGASAELLDGSDLSPQLARRARHVISEIDRVRASVQAIEDRDLARLGTLLRASHRSMRDDFEISVTAVDNLVDLLNAAIGVGGGARMTGGGFGGAVVAVMAADQIERVRAVVAADYRPPCGGAAQIMIEGAGRVPAGGHE
ncbi:MAG: galactokinase [Proteobacteria bacterium]|nr:galactokinase [Pseudomonadota bacterium]